MQLTVPILGQPGCFTSLQAKLAGPLRNLSRLQGLMHPSRAAELPDRAAAMDQPGMPSAVEAG